LSDIFTPLTDHYGTYSYSILHIISPSIDK